MSKIEYTQYNTIKCTFKEFCQLWANMLGWTIPDFHYDIIEWLESHNTWKGRTGVLQIPRNHSKSTLVGLFVVWKLTQNPTLRFLIVSEKKDTATKMVAHTRSIITKHPLAHCLYNKNDPNSKEMWRGDSIKVLGHTDPRSPSVVSLGIRSGMTGWRADFIIADDVEGPTNTVTIGKREKLRAQLKELVHIIEPKGSTLYIGTPHCEDSIYPELIGKAQSTTEEDIKLMAVSSLFMPALTEIKGAFPNMIGIPLWKERMGVEVLLEKQKATGKNAISKGNFYSQYLLIPYRITNITFNFNDMVLYDDEITLSRDGRAFLGSIEIVGMKVYWDPAFGEGDGSALAVTLQDDKGNNYAHWIGRIQMPPEDQCKFIISLAQSLHFTNVTAENNGFGGFMIKMFRKEAIGSGITITPQFTKGEKKARVKDTIGPRLQAGMLYVHSRHKGTPFEQEFNDFDAGGKHNDDTVEAFASSIEIQPIRIKGGQAGQIDNPFRGGYQSAVQMQRSYKRELYEDLR